MKKRRCGGVPHAWTDRAVGRFGAPRIVVTACAARALRTRYRSAMRPWFVYLLECRDGSVYTGIAVDVARRYAQHEAGKGARYTRSRPPARLLGQLAFADRSLASRAEHAIKRLTPARKRALFALDVAAATAEVARWLDAGPPAAPQRHG